MKFKERIFRKVLVGFFLLLISLPYLLYPSQDLPEPVCHDEASYHLNAKDVIMFGPASVQNDRLLSIIFPLNFFVGLLSFSIFGVSLFSLRIPYILLNIIGNIFFFDFLRRQRGLTVAVPVTAVFSLYALRLLMGKAAMAESLTIPLVLILIWCFSFVCNSVKIYFWLTFFGMLIVFSKFDNIFILLFILFFASLQVFEQWRKGEYERAKSIMFYSSLGILAVAVPAAIFYSLIGWKKVIGYFIYVLEPNLNASPWQHGIYYSPFTFQLLKKNIVLLCFGNSGFFKAALLSLFPFLAFNIFSKKERCEPLNLSIFMVLFLLLSKLAVSSALYIRRLSPCYVLAFLLIAFLLGKLQNFSFNNMNLIRDQKQVLKKRSVTLVKNFLVFIVFLFFVYVVNLPHLWSWTVYLVSSPRYLLKEQSKMIEKVFNNRYKALMLNGGFSYLALQLPCKIIYPEPDNEAKEFYAAESNPPLAKKLIYENDDISYVFFCYDNNVIRNIIEDEFNGRMIACNLLKTVQGVMYYIPPRRR